EMAEHTVERSNTRQLIITADDCGLSEGINAATRDLHRSGLMTTATLMMNFSAVSHAVHTFREVPTLKTGVHLNLTDGYPLSDIDPASMLVQSDGRFQSRTVLFPRAIFPNAAWLAAVEGEMTAQIEAYIHQVGRKPHHLTTHMHFHILPSLRDLVLGLAQRYEIEWVRAFETSSTVIPYNFFVQEPTELFRPDNLKITPDYIVSAQAWMNLSPQRLVDTLLSLNGLIELVVHPDDPEDATYPVEMNHRPDERARERDYLLRFAEAMAPHAEAFVIADPSP
ncbi:MAG: ChbG/HpnK family deacetylase, partial [Chloroflexota bacterium]